MDHDGRVPTASHPYESRVAAAERRAAAAEKRADAEKRRADAEKRRADAEKRRADAAEAENAELKTRVAELETRVAGLEKLEDRRLFLEDRANRDSGNSSKPPSTDWPGKPVRQRSLREKTGRKPGGQPGRTGGGPRFLEEGIVESEDVLPKRCRRCHTALDGSHVEDRSRRQLIDLPETRPTVSQRYVATCRCPNCGTTTAAKAPEGFERAVQFGPRAKAEILSLRYEHHIPVKRIAAIVRDHRGLDVSTGAVVGVEERYGGKLGPVLAAIVEGLVHSGFICADETSLTVNGKMFWAHTKANEEYTLVTVDPRRNREAAMKDGVLERFHGVLVTDCCPIYFCDEIDGRHQLCNVHVLRELQAVEDRNVASDRPPDWESKAAKILRDGLRLRDEALAAGETVPESAMAALGRRLDRALRPAIERLGKPDGRLEREELALARRIDAKRDMYLLYLTDLRIPADNNIAERDHRPLKLREKISGGARSRAGAERLAAFTSYLSTARKQGLRMFDALLTLAAGKPWMPATA